MSNGMLQPVGVDQTNVPVCGLGKLGGSSPSRTGNLPTASLPATANFSGTFNNWPNNGALNNSWNMGSNSPLRTPTVGMNGSSPRANNRSYNGQMNAGSFNGASTHNTAPAVHSTPANNEGMFNWLLRF